MADVTKTIENIDRLFSQIIVNGEVHESQNYVPPTPQQVTPSSTQNDTPSQTTPSTPTTQTQGEPVYAVELNKVIHDFVDRVVTQGLANEIQARQAADNILQGYINALNALIPSSASSTNKLATSAQLQTVADKVTIAQADISDIEALIPNQASQSNQLADKNFVNSSIATNTANFLGTYTSLSDIEAIQNPTNNDYAYLQTTDSAGNTQFQRYKYSSSDNQWHYEYTLNNSSFTVEQWATINSGLTASSVAQSISDAINALDVASSGGSSKYIESISEVNGKIVPVEANIADSVTSDNLHSVSSDAVARALNTGLKWFLGSEWTKKIELHSYLTPADVADMNGGSSNFHLTYGKDYLQMVNVTWDDYSSHNAPAGAGGIFIPSYQSNGGTLILVDYPSTRFIFNVWIDSNRWSGWHYVDLAAIVFS